ncbi:SRPBCC family protein [Pseudonocardia sp. CA-107938]|uniref:SRPBCC family protein n=1 Tax=Pseudonocardia sp. CA-107938 TaxID=3240021 RepID=UPI003D9066A7
MSDETVERFEVSRTIPASPSEIFAVLRDPQGHVDIDSSGMLQDFTGEPVSAAGDTFVIHMDRESLGDVPLGRYDVTVAIRTYEPDREISWTILGAVRPPIGHVYGYRLTPDGSDATVVTSFYDWSDIDPVWRERAIFPILPESALKATLGILERTVRRRIAARR